MNLITVRALISSVLLVERAIAYPFLNGKTCGRVLQKFKRNGTKVINSSLYRHVRSNCRRVCRVDRSLSVPSVGGQTCSRRGGGGVWRVNPRHRHNSYGSSLHCKWTRLKCRIQLITYSFCSLLQETTAPNSYGIQAGSSFISSGTSLTQGRVATRVIPHPNYSPVTYDNDIAILKLDSPLWFNKAIAPIALPPAGFIPKIGAKATASGWGATSENGQSPEIGRASCRERV